MDDDEIETRRRALWERTQALIDHAGRYKEGPPTPETTGAIVDHAAEVEAAIRALVPYLGDDDAEIQRSQRVLERIKNILRVHEAMPGTALIVDYTHDFYSSN